MSFPASTSPFKPSPLTFAGSPSGSPRTSPFKRQNSTASNESKPSTTHNSSTSSSQSNAPPLNERSSPPSLRPSTPSQLANRAPTPSNTTSNRPSTPSKLHAASTPANDAATFSSRAREAPSSPTRSGAAPSTTGGLSMSGSGMSGDGTNGLTPPRSSTGASTPRTTIHTTPQALYSSPSKPAFAKTPTAGNNSACGSGGGAAPDALSRIPPTLLHSLRESFSVLDSSSASHISMADVHAMHAQLSLPAASQAAYFPPGTPNPLPLAPYLQSLAGPLSMLSPKEELLAALGAFDEDESGQVDVGELVEAVCGGRHGLDRAEVGDVLAGFTGRRAFGGKAAQGGEVFRYREWVGGLGAGAAEAARGEAGV